MQRRPPTKPGARKFRRDNTQPRSYEIMLDMSKKETFKFAAKKIFNDSDMEEADWGTHYAQITAKAKRISISAALDYINEKQDEGLLSDDICEEFRRLLSRCKKRR